MTLLILLSLILPGFAKQHILAPDFFIDDSPLSTSRIIKPTDCRANIREVICLVGPGTSEELGQMERPCLDGGLHYAPAFEALYDSYPPVMRPLFCSLKRIFIETRFFGTAYAGLHLDAGGKIDGAITGIRQSVLDEHLGLSHWASWKEQLSFGGIKENYSLTPGLPLICSKSKLIANDFVYFVMTHEFGHILDFANKLNRVTDPDCLFSGQGCEIAPHSWGAISWKTTQIPLAHNDFPERPKLCFYWCEENHLPASSIPAVYHSLLETNFISTYATTQPWDDFAESLAYYLSFSNSMRYVLETSDTDYDMRRHFHSRRLKSKRHFIKRFLKRNDIIYP